MPKIRSLTSAQAKKTFAARFAPKADKLRQLATNFGIRPYRVFLVWQKWTGVERGEGDLTTILETELLPTPKVESLDAVAINPITAGTIGMGAVRITKVSNAAFTRDQLMGLIVPGFGHLDHIPEPIEFFYELREDGRGDDPAWRQKYRLSSEPFRRPGKVDWTFLLERISEDRDRQGKSAYLQGTRG